MWRVIQLNGSEYADPQSSSNTSTQKSDHVTTLAKADIRVLAKHNLSRHQSNCRFSPPEFRMVRNPKWLSGLTTTCQPDRSFKVFGHTVIPQGDFISPVARFLHLHADLTGPLLTSAVLIILSYRGRCFQALAGPHHHPGYNNRHSSERPDARLDIPF